MPADHPDSNELLVRKHLLQGEASKANFISLIRDHDSVTAIPRPFDVMVLGMGLDGHFASLFPDMVTDDNAFSLNADPLILWTSIQGTPAHRRATMNLAMILQSRHIFLLVNGVIKNSVLEQAMYDYGLPIAALLHQSVTNIQIVRNL